MHVLQVLGNAKGVVAAGISILIFKNPVTLQGAVGYAIALFGVALYSHVRNSCKSKLRSMELYPDPGKEGRCSCNIQWGRGGGGHSNVNTVYSL
jgi:hypothetical protein